jgi:hypothetical protein
MAHFPNVQSAVRAPRVSLRHPEPADFRVEDQLVHGSLQRISLTGGCASLKRKVLGGTIAELGLSTQHGRVNGIIEFLASKKHGESPFRFVALEDEAYENLRRLLASAG